MNLQGCEMEPQKFFDSYGKKYDVLSCIDFQFFSRPIFEFLEQTGLERLRVLEVGCGSCSFSEKLKLLRPGDGVWGLDLCIDLLRWSSLPVIQGDAHQLPFSDAAFDLIVAPAALHHFPDLRRAMTEIFRVLKTGGLFLSYDPNLYHPQRFIFMTDPLRRIFYRDSGDTALSPCRLTALAREIGFVTVEVEYHAMYNPDAGKMTKFNCALLRHVASRIPILKSIVAPWFLLWGRKP